MTTISTLDSVWLRGLNIYKANNPLAETPASAPATEQSKRDVFAEVTISPEAQAILEKTGRLPDPPKSEEDLQHEAFYEEMAVKYAEADKDVPAFHIAGRIPNGDGTYSVGASDSRKLGYNTFAVRITDFSRSFAQSIEFLATYYSSMEALGIDLNAESNTVTSEIENMQIQRVASNLNQINQYAADLNLETETQQFFADYTERFMGEALDLNQLSKQFGV